MKVIPVLDILEGVAVHAVMGKRKEYKPLKSLLCDSADPLDVALAFRNSGFRWLYVADLDAIIGGWNNAALVKQIADETELSLMVDSGVDNEGKAELLIRYGVSKVVVGTETLKDLAFLENAVSAFGAESVVVSLDMMNGQVLGKFNLEGFSDPVSLLLGLQGIGINEVILLDLARVGSGKGVDFALVSDVLDSVELDVLVGGGVRNMNDLEELDKMGISGVLLATALHSGKIPVDELLAAGFTL